MNAAREDVNSTIHTPGVETFNFQDHIAENNRDGLLIGIGARWQVAQTKLGKTYLSEEILEDLRKRCWVWYNCFGIETGDSPTS